MSNKNKNYSKKWLISRLKTSGSKRRYVLNQDYSDTRHSKRRKNWENLPSRESIKSSYKFYNGKINVGPLLRYLRSQAGNDWDQVYSRVLERIPSGLMEYKGIVKRFVADKVEIRDGSIWDKRANKYIKTSSDESFGIQYYLYKEFYVDPESNKLIRVQDFPTQKKTKKMNSDQLRELRESEQKKKLEERRSKKRAKEKMIREVNEILRNKSEDDIK